MTAGARIFVTLLTILITGSIAIPAIATDKPDAPATAPGDEHWDDRFGGISGLGGMSFAVAIDGSDVYVGGNFTTAGGVSAIRIARWNGTSWSAVGNGLAGIVRAIAVDGSNVYAGGDFTAISGGGAALRVARWNGSSWSAMSSGMNQPVWDMAVAANGDVYAVGEFTTAGGLGALRVARWNGSAWSALGSGLAGDANIGYAVDIAPNGDVYVGGSFTTAGGQIAGRVARWNGSMWSDLNGGLNTNVYEVKVAPNGDVYVGGAFTVAGGSVPVLRIARWNGSVWSALGGAGAGVSQDVWGIGINGNDIYVSGIFTVAAGSVTTLRVAQFDGNNWLSMGSGLGVTQAWRLAVSGDDVYVAGDFTTAGGKASNYFARWNEAVIPVLIFGFAAEPLDEAVQLSWDVYADEPIDGFRIYRREGSSGFVPVNSQLIARGASSYVDRSVTPGNDYTYMLSVVKPDGSEIQSTPVAITAPVAAMRLEQAYPNPFNPTTTIRFSLPVAADATLTIYDVKGRAIVTLVDEVLSAGTHNARWDGKDSNGSTVASGVYFYRLVSGRDEVTRKMVLAK